MVKQNQFFPQSVPHPCETLSEKLKEMGMGPKEFALRTGKPEKTISAVIKGTSSITTDMAVQFENVTKIPADFWMNHQRSYDEYIARIKRQDVIGKAVAWSRNFPLSHMIKSGWIEKQPDQQLMAAQLLTFFGVASPKAWEDYYCNRKLKVAFRISLKQTRAPYALSAWLRMGEISAREIQTKQYSAKSFKETLPKIKDIIESENEVVFQKIQKVCLKAGVKMIHIPSLPKVPVSGATRWLNDTPLIQLSGREKRSNKFWFSFFHEAGHILLHGKKEIFLEKIDYKDKDLLKEKEADVFAFKYMKS